ncbi:MAG: hypothetical protein ABI083_19375 [Lapillicoccus sp.]
MATPTPPPQPPTHAEAPPFTRSLVAGPGTASRLALDTAVALMRRPSRLWVLVALVALGTLAFLTTRSAAPLLFTVGVAVVLFPLVWLLARRSTRLLAPRGFELRLGLGPTSVAVQHGVASAVIDYTSLGRSEVVGQSLLLFFARSSAALPLPLALVGDDLDRLVAAVRGTAPAPAPAGDDGSPRGGPPGTAPDPSVDGPTVPASPDPALPWSATCTVDTHRAVFRAVIQQRFGRAAGVVATACLVGVLVLTIVRPTPTGVALVGILVVLWGTIVVSIWRRTAFLYGAGAVMRAGLTGTDLTVQDASGTSTLPASSIRDVSVRPGVVIVTATTRAAVYLPEGLLPHPEVDRLRAVVAARDPSR